jgi:phosphoenolpyruvate carboxykinase (ATP)
MDMDVEFRPPKGDLSTRATGLGGSACYVVCNLIERESMSASILAKLDLSAHRVVKNASSAELVERAIAAGEGQLAENGALVCLTGDRTGRSPKDKHLEDVPAIHDKIWWGKVNTAVTPAQFDAALEIAVAHLNNRPKVHVFEGYAGADPKHRLGVQVVTEQAWHSLFASTLFIRQGTKAAGAPVAFKKDWTIINAGKRRLTAEEQAKMGYKAPVMIAQSLTRKIVVILGSEYAGEMKKSIFYAMNYDMPEVGVFPMHCSCNVDKATGDNAALFFGLVRHRQDDPLRRSQPRPHRRRRARLVGQGRLQLRGWLLRQVHQTQQEGEPEIWNAIKFGSVLENTVIDPVTRVPDYDSAKLTENTRVTYPVDFIEGAVIPSVCGHPKNIIFLTADAFGVMPPVSKLNPEQAMYYFINGYTAKLAGTEAGVTEPQPNFSPCFGGVFLPRQPDRLRQHARRQDQEARRERVAAQHGLDRRALRRRLIASSCPTPARSSPRSSMARLPRPSTTRTPSSASTFPRPSPSPMASKCPRASSCPATPGRTARRTTHRRRNWPPASARTRSSSTCPQT